ncbi:hypothetical protein LEP1GSC061_2204 [Leptospira wolffii serovar Khorat str. Khorat-H2]|nr:hypothetical protein LEP1GSC061_2204 [Leptospira wolffii serovar Khorat str. Khorat-H2]
MNPEWWLILNSETECPKQEGTPHKEGVPSSKMRHNSFEGGVFCGL